LAGKAFRPLPSDTSASTMTRDLGDCAPLIAGLRTDNSKHAREKRKAVERTKKQSTRPREKESFSTEGATPDYD